MSAAQAQMEEAAETGTPNLKAGVTIGLADATLSGKLRELDPMEQIPSFVPGKNLEKGQTLAGRYVGTKRVLSEKFKGGKRNADGKKYRDLHTLRDVKSGEKFGIWSVGALGIIFDRARAETAEQPGQYLELKYLGQDGKPIREGESPSHEFDVKSNEELGERAPAAALNH